MTKKILFSQAHFAASVFQKDQFPKLSSHTGAPLPEIAIIGKSNVGKSSLINNLLRNKKLAKTSSTPGKTQSLNFYTIDDALALVDLPGYGFAHVSDATKGQWSESLQFYLEQRNELKLILFLLDARRIPTEDDLSLLQWAATQNIPFLVVFTKTDKLNTSEKQIHKTTIPSLIQQTIPDHSLQFAYYSIKDPRSRMGLIEHINTLLKAR
jgi:GTP-binding protein